MEDLICLLATVRTLKKKKKKKNTLLYTQIFSWTDIFAISSITDYLTGC